MAGLVFEDVLPGPQAHFGLSHPSLQQHCETAARQTLHAHTCRHPLLVSRYGSLTTKAAAERLCPSIAGHDVSAGSLSLQYWGRDDREAYLKAMTAALSPFLKQESA